MKKTYRVIGYKKPDWLLRIEAERARQARSADIQAAVIFVAAVVFLVVWVFFGLHFLRGV
jgi:hypothetical protein